MKLFIGHKQGRIGSPNFGEILFQGVPIKNADLQKKKGTLEL
jgi:hypothetical protein